jgi:hypothetical protein
MLTLWRRAVRLPIFSSVSPVVRSVGRLSRSTYQATSSLLRSKCGGILTLAALTSFRGS